MDRLSWNEVNDVKDMASFDDDVQISLAQKYQRNAALRWLFTVVNGSFLLSWIIGATGLSFAWLILLGGVIAAVWSSSLVKLIEETKNDEITRIRRRKALLRDETAEWLNFLFNRWWIYSSKSIFQLMRERFEPLLNDVKPPFVENVELHQFTFGDQTPCVKFIKAYDIVDGKRLPLTCYNLQHPSGLCKNVKHQVAVEVDLYLNSEEFRLILRTRLFGKGMGVDLDVAMEKLNLCGKLDVTFTIDMESPFPHVTDVTLMFAEKPEIWFSVRVLKAVQMMEVPILKTWIHSVIMDALETSLVDPGKLHLDLSATNRTDAGIGKAVSVAQGVLTLTLTASQIGYTNGDLKWVVLRLGEQYWKTSTIAPNWSETPSFLVESLQTDKLIIKLKSKKLVSIVTLAQYEMKLDEYNLENSHSVETTLQKKHAKSGNIPSISICLEYTPLPSVVLEQCYQLQHDTETVCGVFTVFIHGAQGLTFSDSSQCNSYCMFFSNQRKVKTTHVVYNSTSPQWETRCQILVNDYTRTSLSFVVCSWNPKPMMDDEMLGMAALNFSKDETWLVHQQLPLSGSSHSLSTIKVSAVFQPVCAMSGKNFEIPPSPGSENEAKADLSNGRIKRNSSSWVQQAKYLLGRGDQEIQRGSDISNILTSGLGLMEISILRARDLVPMDMNGFSDPYCELKVNNECKYKSSVKKKTLNPIWEENAIMGMPRAGESFEVMVWDHDTFGMKDFLGSVTFSLDEIRQMSSLDCSHWYALQGVRSGEVELKVKVIADDASSSQDNVSIASSKRTTQSYSRTSAEPSPIIRRPSMERSRVKLGVHVPPPTPPRTVSIPQKTAAHTLVHEVHKNLTNGVNFLSDNSSINSVQSVPLLPRVTVTGSPSRASSRASSQMTTDLSIGEPSPSPQEDIQPKKHADSELTTFRSMKQKVSRSLRLRRFKSEVNVRSQNNGKTVLEPRGSGEADATELLHNDPLSHAVSQPNIHKIKSPVRPTELNICPMARPDKYTGVEGKVLQAQGLHVAHVAQLYCRIKLIGATPNEKIGKSDKNQGKTLAKSHLLPAMPNPQFDLPFQISNPETVPRQAVLLFEIRSSSKEIMALRRVTLQDLLSGDNNKETHTWLALNNGSTLEITIAHGRELKKQSRKLFRSWSVHRIGKY